MKRLHTDQNMLCASTKIKPIFVLALLITLSVFCFATQTQAGPPPIQTFFVPLPELQVETSLEAVDTGDDDIGDVMRSMVSIVATGDSTIIYYDHWEDGYELDLANPVQASTRIWGDNNPANGMPPGFATDEIDAGDVITLENDVALPRNPAEIHFDGRDKFGGTRAVAVTRASWAVEPGVVLAGAVEVYPLRDYGLRFEVPVGEDLGSNEMFQYTSLFVLAAEDGTDIQIDIDGDGSTDITQTLNQGESYQVDGGIDTGASVTATKPVQAHIFTGDIGARFESRFFTLYPVENWSDSYYSPVGTAADGDETYVFVYNPNGGAITVDYETRIGTGSFSVAAGSSYRYLMPSQSGAHFFTSGGSTFFAIATVGADPGANLVHDWGFSLLPESYLTPMAIVGWGPGSDDLSENGSPVWVTAVAATTVYVDYDGDPATGPMIDANGDHYDVDLNLATLESARVYDNSDNDQTGMKLYTLDGTLITAAWGQDPATSQGGLPFLDLGTTVLPFPIASVEKTSAHVVDENSNGLIDWGDTIEYTITVNNDGVIVLGGVVAFDPLPNGTTYVPDSTTLNGAPVADETAPATPYPMDEGGLAMPVIPPTEFTTITFRVIVNFGTTTITNSVSINTDLDVLTTDDTIDVNTPDVTACSLEFTDAGGVSQATYLENNDMYVTVDDNDQNTDAGTTQSFTVVVVNPDSGDVETITLTETGNDTGIFRNTAALASSTTGGMSDEDGTLYAAAGNTVQVAFTDPVFGDTCSDTAGITIPTEIKPLYLSEPGQSMDRVDPVATGDATTATSAALSFIGSGTTGMAVWSAAAIPEYNPWDGSSFGTTQDALTQTIRWRTMAGAAAPTRDEKIVVGIEDGGEISGELWNGSSWSKTDLTSLDFVNETYWFGADVTYEQQSGDAVLVWNGGNTSSGELRYKVWNGSTWTIAASVGAYTGGEPQTMHMAAKPGADEMVLVVNDINADDYALVWNGATWGNTLSLDTSGTAENDQSAFFVAYEQQSGRAMVVYGKDGDANGYYKIWNGSSWEPGEGTITAPAGVSSQIAWIRLASDPNSNRIVLGVLTTGGIAADVWLNVWDGSSWGTALQAETTATGSIFPNVAVAFESQSGQALAVYGENGQNIIRYRTWSSGGGWSGEQTDGSNIGAVPNTMILDSDPLSNDIMLTVQDNDITYNLNYVLWNGASWETPTELETNTQEIKNQPFVFLYDQHIVPVGSSTTFTQSPVMCQDFVMPMGGQVTVTNYINVSPTNGSVSRSISASNDDAEEEGPDGDNPNDIYLDSSDIELVEDFQVPNAGTQLVGMRFNNITVPQGATITNAYITFRADTPEAPNTNSDPTSLTIEGQAADNPGTFTSTASDITNRPRAAASAPWSPLAWTTGSDYNTPDISGIAQELVNRAGWTSGNSMVFIVTGTNGSRAAESWDSAGSNPPQLTIEYTTDSMPANPAISATIKHDGTTIETLTNPTVTDLGAGIYQLDWTDVISSNTTVLAGEQVDLEVTTAEPGLSFEILYDSNTYPSKIMLPTTTVIVIHVDTLAAYDAPHPDGSPITDAQNGATLYLRATVSDPFGTDDITDLNLSISDPCGGGPINVTLDDADVVATAGCSKTYEYTWNTSMCQGNYDIVAVANEGTEGITDSATIRVTLTFTDTGTAGISAFTDGTGNPVSNYNADATICVQVTDMDQNANRAVAETLSAVVASAQGDSETMTLTETGPDTGIFRACIASSSTGPAVPDDGSLYALPGDVLVANYTDPDDSSDTSDDTALVNTPAADMTIAKLLVDPVDGTAQVNDLIRFDIVVGSPGPTDLTSFIVTDTFDAGCLSYDAASIAPNDPAANPLTWDETELGTLPVGSSVTVSVWFRADAACAPTVNTVSAGGLDEFGTAVSAGPATAQVTITRPELSVTKTLISPNPGPAYVGDPVTFRITLNNTGTSEISTLPLEDTFSAACFDFQSATVAPDGIGAGSLLWNNLGPLATSDPPISLDVTLTVTGECNPAQNTADVSFAVDVNGDSVPPDQDSAGLQTIGAEIGDRVWNDRNGDGVQDAGEGGIVNVIVFVDVNADGTRDAGEPYDTTDVTGAYDITDLAAGSYTVWVDATTIPAGATLTGGSNPLAVTVADGEDFNTADFGYQGNASIGDFIWDDVDGDGNQDGGEPGLANVTVFLDMDGDGVLDAGEPFAVTDGSGNYDFTNLVVGDYVVDVDDTTLPPNYVLTTSAASLPVTLGAGEDYNDADFGYRQQGGVNGHLFDDVDGDGVQDAGEADLAGIDVVITDSNGDQQTVTTDADGDYQAFAPPGATTLDVDDTTLPPNAFITTANDPQTVSVNGGAFTDSSDVGYQFGIPSRMKLRTGSYTGNGIAGTPISGLGFEPDMVIIKAADTGQESVIRTSTMTDDSAKPMGGATAFTADLIQSLDANGFTIGRNDRVNKDGITYHWIAFEAGDGEMVVDTYTGNGVDNTSVYGVGFQPDYVMVLPAINEEPVHRSSAQTGDTTSFFKNSASTDNHIQALEADGFQVGDDDRVNKLDETYHYIAWKEVAGKMAVDSYDGNATDDTEISGLGFEPEYVIIKQDNGKEAVHRPDSLDGDNTLWFVNQVQSMDMIQELQSDGFQIGLDDNVNASSETYYWAAFAGSHLTISSAADQAFYVNDPPTVIQTITITEDNLDPTITAANDIRIRIPAGFNMTWDTSVTTASIGGMAAAKVSAAVSYEDGDRTLVIDVTSDFAASEQVTISLLRFNNFTARSPADNLELEVDNGDTVAAVDDKTIAVVAPTISSAANQYFIIGSPAKAIQTITITEDSIGPSITAANDIRIRIPAGFNMTWDTSVATATIGGSAAGKVSATVSYEDGDRTLVIDVISNFAASDQITISDLSFTDFTAASLPDNLELEVKDDGLTTATDDKTIAIGDISISSADNQEFYVGGPVTAISTITITEDSSAAVITMGNDIRIRIPDNFYMLWDTTEVTPVFGGTAASKVSNTVSYEDSGKTLVLDVTEDFAASDQITISGLSFTNFTAGSSGDHLELEVFNDGQTTTEDDKFKAIGGTPSAGSMLVYGEGSVITPRYRTWDGLLFSAEASANDTDDVIKWAVIKPSPIEYEMVMATYSSADKNLYVQTWDGSNWTSNWNTHLNYDGATRVFDIAYENNSGDVVVVFGDNNDNTLKYRKRVNGTWDGSDQLLMTPDNQVNWVRAESRPGSDDIFVATVASSKSLYALRWDGTANSWGDQIQTAAGVFDAGREGFDIAFESASGDAFLVWGDAAKNVKYREFTTGWQAETTAYTLLPDNVQWLAAAYDPQATGSDIAIAMVLDNNTFEFGAWNGSDWVGRPAAIVAPNKDNRFIDVAFESNTGEAIYGFSQNANADGDPAEDDRMKLSWRTWTSSGGFSSVIVQNGLSDEIKFVQLKADPNSDDIMAVYADKEKDLYHRFWDGSTWTALEAPLETAISDESQQEAFMFVWKASPPTAVNLLFFTATGQDGSVLVSWETAHEINNMGFYLYRSDNSNGPFIKLTDTLIPGADFSTLGKKYAYIDKTATRGQIYYYRLVDVETSGKLTYHGPICVDWDGDGLPDDWELAHGLNPTVDDAGLDADNDGLTNIEEYERGSDPNNPDSDGDGILDGDEHFQYGPTDPGGSLSLSRGVHVLTSDETGITLELRTAAFETATIQVGGEQFEKLSVKEYVHGFTAEVGKPRLPLKGILLDIPAGQSAHLTVLDSASTIGYGYRVYPVPQNYADDLSYSIQVAELFTLDADVYGQDAFYPESVAGLGEVYNFREQLKQQLIFYPLSFNPVSGQIRHYSRIRVRVDYEDTNLAKAPKAGPQPWVPPSGNKILLNPIPMAPTAMAFIGPAFLNSPIISAIASLGTLAQAAWMPPGFDWATQGPAYKLLVAEAGVYRLTGSYLAASGVNLAGVNIGQVRLYNLSTEIAAYVYDDNGDNGFDGNDYIEFYATAVASGYAKYTNYNVYWLTLAGGTGAPLRMGVIDATPDTGPDTATHDFTVHYEPDQGYWQEAPGADSLDRWIIGAIALGDEIDKPSAGQPVSFDLPIVDVDDTETGTLKISLYGGYDTDHEVRVSYEGEELGTFAWSGYRDYEVTIEDVDFSEQTGDGKYTVSVTCLSGFDRIAFDWIEATYPRKFVANDDRLRFTHDSGYLFTIDNFSTDELMILDITATDEVMRVDGFDIFEPIASSFSLEFESAADGQTHTYLVIAETEVNTTAAAVVEDSASDLAETSNGADYILITHDDIGWDGSGSPYQWLDDLAALRQAQGLRVKVVNVQDIYDEFSYGLVTPQAIKDFLTYAYENWSVPAPQYVLLVGDSSYDFKDNWGYGTINYVPAYLTYTEYMGETVTDEWFVTVNGDDAVADMYIGRLPAQSAAEAQVMVAKIMAYETGLNTKTWEKNTLLVADDQEEAFESVFKTMNEDAAALLPTGMDPPYKGYLQDYLDAGFSRINLNKDILDQINAGALIANFSGHGYLRGWASPSIFDAGDIDSLTNAGKYPFIVSMNCLTGYFAYPDPNPLAVSFAELLLRAEEKGTAAALMPTGMTTTAGQHVMNTALFETIFVEDVRRLGPAIARAKRELLANGDAYFEQVSQTFLLFGDPAMQLRVPLPRRPSGLAPAVWTKSGVALRWDAATDCNNNPVAGYNVYRSTSPTGNFTKINQAAITQPEFTDDTASATAAAASSIYYYTVTAVDTDGDESIPSAMAASPSLAAVTGISSGGSGGGGGGCFVSAAATSFELANIPTAAIYWILMVCGVFALFMYFLKNALDSPSALLRGMTN